MEDPFEVKDYSGWIFGKENSKYLGYEHCDFYIIFITASIILLYICNTKQISILEKVIMKHRVMGKDDALVDTYRQMMDGYKIEQSPCITTEWPMENGMYQQYSGYDSNNIGVSGTLITFK